MASTNQTAKPSSQDAPGTPDAAHDYQIHERTPRLFTVLSVVVPLVLATCLMAADANYALSVPFGLLCFLVASIGLFDLFQSIDATEPAEQQRRLELRALLTRSVEATGASLALLVALRVAVAGSLPNAVVWAAITIPASFIALSIAGLRLAVALGFADGTRPLHRRYGFWLMLLHGVVYLPLLGSFSLIDPWETHYGEVAREMLARDDWISLWWAQDGWFWSKPVLDFWLQGLSFSLLGVQYQPGQMISGVARGLNPHPEWAARIPIFLMTSVASYTLYKSIGRSLHPRAGFLAALILTTMPYWYLLGHQSMTDMPYVAPLVACFAFLLLGLSSDREARVQSKLLCVGGREFSFNSCHVLLLLVLLCVLPQVCYLFSRNLTLYVDTGMLSVHADYVLAGSGGNNCGLVGNAACSEVLPRTKLWQPALLALLWLFLLLVFFKLIHRERHTQKLYFLAAWFCLALSAMAKGAPGLVLPVFVCVAFLAATKRWRVLVELKPAGFLLIFACMVLPWYVQMVMRHGSAFTERLLLHDMYKRAFDHVHDTNEGVDVSFRYYLWQLGYGLFPWSGLAAAGLLQWVRQQTRPQQEQLRITSGEVTSFFALWFIAAFGMFTLSGTKFHHYILPAVPPLAALAGMLLHDLIGNLKAQPRPYLYCSGLSAATCLALVGTALCVGGPLSGIMAEQPATPAASSVLGSSLLCGSAVLAAMTLRYTRPGAPASPVSGSSSAAAWFGLVSALGAWMIGRDLLARHGEEHPGQVVLMQLFTYQYERGWPESLEFTPTLTSFTLIAVLLFVLWLHQNSRRHAVVAACALSIFWCAWGVNVYLVQAAPHWGQRESIAAYYKLRKSSDPPLLAYQMNWKGENFYTGNRVVAFVKSKEPFVRWIQAQREAGVQTLYVSTEPSRIGSLKRELGQFKSFEVLTSPRQNSRFMIARVEL